MIPHKRPLSNIDQTVTSVEPSSEEQPTKKVHLASEEVPTTPPSSDLTTRTVEHVPSLDSLPYELLTSIYDLLPHGTDRIHFTLINKRTKHFISLHNTPKVTFQYRLQSIVNQIKADERAEINFIISKDLNTIDPTADTATFALFNTMIDKLTAFFDQKLSTLDNNAARPTKENINLYLIHAILINIFIFKLTNQLDYATHEKIFEEENTPIRKLIELFYQNLNKLNKIDSKISELLPLNELLSISELMTSILNEKQILMFFELLTRYQCFSRKISYKFEREPSITYTYTDKTLTTLLVHILAKKENGLLLKSIIQNAIDTQHELTLVVLLNYSKELNIDPDTEAKMKRSLSENTRDGKTTFHLVSKTRVKTKNNINKNFTYKINRPDLSLKLVNNLLGLNNT